MFDKPRASHVLGLDLDDFSFKGAAVSISRNKIKIDSLFDYLIDPSEVNHVKPLYTDEQKAHLTALAGSCLVVTAAATEDVLVRPLEMHLTKDKDIDAALAFQVEPILPYPPENALVDKILLSKDKEGSKLSVVAIRKDHLTRHLELWRNLDIESEIVSAAPQALALFSNTFYKTEEPIYVLQLGISNSFCCLLDNGKLIAAQTVPGGIKNLLEIYAQENNIDLPAAYAQLVQQQQPYSLGENTKTAVEALRLNITRTTYALAKQFKNKEIKQILITGPGALLAGLHETLCASLNKTLLTSGTDTTTDISQHDQLLYALPIGEALSALPNQDQINFRQQEFTYPEPWKRLKQPILQYFFLFLGVAAALTIFGKAYVLHQEGETKRQYLELLNAMNKPYNEFEKEFTTKFPSSRNLAEGEVIPPGDLTTDEIKSRLSTLEKEIQSTPQIFPLQPNTPLVSDVLAWITSHPIVVNKGSGEEGDNKVGGLQIESFNYTMVKRPEPTKKQEKYQVKVELEFSTPTPKLAREFHDALIAPNDIVDPKGEIKWGSNRDLYRTSFYLKDKTMYPNP